MLSILVIRGALLDGIYIGVYNYVANFDVNGFAEPDLWKDVVNQQLKLNEILNFISILSIILLIEYFPFIKLI